MRTTRATMMALAALCLAAGGLRADLRSHWTFDGTLEESLGTGNDGVFYKWDGVVSTPALPVFETGYDGTENGAVSFDGVGDYVALTRNDGLLPVFNSREFTLAMWVKGPPFQLDRRIFSEASSVSNTPLFNLGTHNLGANGAFDFFLRDDSVVVVNHVKSVREPFDDTWHHIAFVYDFGTVAVYIDAFPSPVNFNHVMPNLSIDTTSIGAILRAVPSFFFQGAIDDLRIYDHALTAEEVLELVPDPFTCPEEGGVRCLGLDIIAAGTHGTPGLYTVIADAETDFPADPILYTFTADNGAGIVRTVGPQEFNFADFPNLAEGTWTISVLATSANVCAVQTPESVCTETLVIACPAVGDTHCGTLVVEGPADGGPGTYTLIALDAVDDSGDPIWYRFTADNGVDPVMSFTPSMTDVNTASFTLKPGNWTLTVTVYDDPVCRVLAPDATCTLEIVVSATAPRLVSHWTLDGHTEDAQPDANDGIYMGGFLETYVEGFDGADPGALSFDGFSEYVEVLQESGLPITAHSVYSVCLWVKGPPGQVDRRVFSEAIRNPTGRNPLFNIGTHNTGADGTVDIFIRGDSGAVPVNHRHSHLTAFDDTWHHIAWVDDNGKAILYVDGVRDATNFSYAPLQLTADTTSIGGILRAAPSHWFQGAIDDVRVYNYALTHAEILDLVPEPDGCPAEGQTHLGGIAITGEGPGIHTVRALNATHDTGGPILYTFTAVNEEGRWLQVGPVDRDFADFFLIPGTWTISVTVDADILCRARAADATRSQTITVEPIDPRLVCHLPLDGDLDDATGSGNDGVMPLPPGPVFVEDHTGAPGRAMRFDGITDYIQITHTDGLPITQEPFFSIAMWVKGAPATPQVADRRVFSESSSLSNAPLFNIGIHNAGTGVGDENARVNIYIRNDANAAVIPHRRSQGVAFDDTWHHIAWVDMFGEVTLYIDGEPDPVNFSYNRPIALTVDTTTVGAILRQNWTPPVSHRFTGALDDVRLYNYALTQSQIQAVIEGTVQPPDKQFSRGDVNDDGNRNIADAISLLGFLFGGGPAPVCPDAADANDDGVLNIADAISILSHLFASSGPLPPPFPGCGVDTTPSALPECKSVRCP